MNCTVNVSPDDLQRLPGLYRRWELPDLLELHRQYLIEEAGAHADGSPLYAVYAAVSAIDSSGGERASGPTDRRARCWRCPGRRRSWITGPIR